MRQITLVFTVLLLAVLACNAPTPTNGGPLQPPTPPTLDGAGGGGEEETEPTATTAPTDTSEPTATDEPTETSEPSPTPTETPSPTPTVFRTPTRPPGSPTPALGGGALTVRGVSFLQAQRVAGTANDANVILRIEFRGGTGPYSLFGNENQPFGSRQAEGVVNLGGQDYLFLTFTERSSCGATLVKAVTIQSANGQSIRQSYFVDVVCPP